MIGLLVGTRWLAARDRANRFANTTSPIRTSPVAIHPHELLESAARHYSSPRPLWAQITMSPPPDAAYPLPAYEFAWRPPNRFLLRPTSASPGDASMISDGEHLYTSMSLGPGQHFYSASAAPSSIGSLLDHPDFGLMPAGGLDMFVILPFLAGTVDESLLEGVTQVEHVGMADDAGVRCHRLRLTEPEGVSELWFHADGPPHLRKLVIPGPDGETISFAWNDADPPASLFDFTPPLGAREVSSIWDIDFGEGDEAEPHPLIGMPAPSFALPLHGGAGRRLDLAAGDEVVVLDFWASWCAPCMRSLPIVARVAGEFEGRGVAFYTVNIQDTDETISRIREKRSFDFPIAMDRDGAAAAAFGADAIPLTVVIRRDGIVVAAHVGAVPNLEATLRRDIEAALATEQQKPGDD